MNGLKYVRAAMRRRYLKNCTFEVHDGKLKMALAKKVVKDKCPSCYGAITEAVNENYRCKYCNNLIMDVVVNDLQMALVKTNDNIITTTVEISRLTLFLNPLR